MFTLKNKSLDKTRLVIFVVGILLGFLAGFFTSKSLYDKPLDVGIEIDTIIVYDTVPDIAPSPKYSATIKYVTKWLPSATKTDTITRWDYFPIHDTVAVQVPITSKHYGNETYDAYISGFEPNLDSIFVYQKTEYITKTVTLSKPPNKWELDVVGGTDYDIKSKQLLPYAGGELTLNNHKRLKMGIEGGVKKDEVTKDFEPYVGAKVKYRIF